MPVIDDFFAGSKLALAKVISHIENEGPDLPQLMPILYAKAGKSYKIGLTGPPGVGKSTLVDRLAEKYAATNKVGIVAVDPSSPFTGGALLGDRIRMQNLTTFDNIFIRSMATRGSSGGLAAATADVAVALDAFGHEIILIETVGVGQVELDIADTCDTTIVVLVPESGDSIQAMKAGLMEIADIFVINKADRPGADKTIAELNLILETKRQATGWELPVIGTEAVKGKGIDELLEKIERHRQFQHSDARGEKHHRRKIRVSLMHALEKRLKRFVAEHLLPESVLETYIDEIKSGQSNPYSLAEKIVTSLDQDRL